jgi:catechol 2,3-dioxygenase-like lactoylglutathione lyase family enzyme
MTIELNHTIVRTRDKQAGAAFLGRILGLPVGDQWGPFVPVQVGGVTFDYMDVDEEVSPQHYAFLVADDEFDAGLARLTEDGVQIWADPGLTEPDVINHEYGGRGVYFKDPDGHLLELITAPYS